MDDKLKNQYIKLVESVKTNEMVKTLPLLKDVIHTNINIHKKEIIEKQTSKKLLLT